MASRSAPALGRLHRRHIHGVAAPQRIGGREPQARAVKVASGFGGELQQVARGARRHMAANQTGERHQGIAAPIDVHAGVRRPPVHGHMPFAPAQSGFQAEALRHGPGRRLGSRRGQPAQHGRGAVRHDAGGNARFERHERPPRIAARPRRERVRGRDGEFVPGFLTHDHGELRIEHQAEVRRLVLLQVRRDVLARGLLVAAHQQPDGVSPRPPAVAQRGHGQQRLHQRALVVRRAASVDVAVLLYTGERRHAPAFAGHLHVAMDNQPEHRRARGPGQLHLRHRPRIAEGEAEFPGHPPQPHALVRVRPRVALHGGEPDGLRKQRNHLARPRAAIEIPHVIAGPRGQRQQACQHQ